MIGRLLVVAVLVAGAAAHPPADGARPAIGVVLLATAVGVALVALRFPPVAVGAGRGAVVQAVLRSAAVAASVAVVIVLGAGG